MTDSELKSLCEKEYADADLREELSHCLHAILRQVVPLDPEPPKKSRGTVLAEKISFEPAGSAARDVMDRREGYCADEIAEAVIAAPGIQKQIATAIDQAIADERQACVRIVGYTSAGTADRLNEARKQEETR